jgi:hypothetical protein
VEVRVLRVPVRNRCQSGRRAAPVETVNVDYLQFVQWPAMIATLVAAWFVASSDAGRRNLGFWLFLASNALWMVWGFHANAWALIVLQVGLAAMNIRGTLKTEDAQGGEHAGRAGETSTTRQPLVRGR